MFFWCFRTVACMHETSHLEPGADYILSAAACRVIWVGGANQMPAAAAFSGASFHSCVILYCSIKLLKCPYFRFYNNADYLVGLVLISLRYVSNLHAKSF